MSFNALFGLVSAPGGAAFWAHRRVADILPVFLPGNRIIDSRQLPERGAFDSLVLMTDSFSSAWAGFRSGIPARIGHGGQFRSALLTETLPLPAGRGSHHSLDYANLARAAGADVRHLDPVPLAGGGEPHVAIFAGAAYGPAKRWMRFPSVAASISKETGLKPVFYGSASEDGYLNDLAREAGASSSVAAGLPLPELCSRLSDAVLAVGNDSGGMHLAAFMGIPSVVLFGSTAPVWTAPAGRIVSIIESELGCSPCFRPRCGRGDVPPCLDSIGAGRVLDAAMLILAGRKGTG